MKHFLLIITVLVVFCTGIAAQDNPFVPLTRKDYADYRVELEDMRAAFHNGDTVQARKIIQQVRQAASDADSREWELNARRFELNLLDRQQSWKDGKKYPTQEVMRQTFALMEEARKANFPALELRLRYDIIENYWLYIKNYELAFEQCDAQDKRLAEVSQDDVPEKALYYVQIANSYYIFKDYPRAIFYFEKVLAGDENEANFRHIQSARNGLGLCYRYGPGDLDRSDSCFRAIVEAAAIDSDNYNREIWNGIAEGNLGQNMALRGKYDAAIPLLKSSLSGVLKHGDYGYASGPAITLAEVYLKKGDLAQAKRHIDLAKEYYLKMPREGRMSQIYEATAKYYAATGTPSLCAAYMDSTLMENKRLSEQFSALQLMRAGQRNHVLEQKAKDEQLKVEKVRSAGYRRAAAITLAGLILAGGFLCLYVALYRKKKAAYRALVQKSQQWAAVEAMPENGYENGEADEPDKDTGKNHAGPDEADLIMFRKIEELTSTQKIYRNTGLTTDSLAMRLGAKRYYIAQAINRCTGKSVNTYINEYRVKEAIRLLSEKDSGKFSFDQIASKCGFNDRQGFYRVFKKMTGLSPAAFRDNARNQELSCRNS